MSDNEPAFEVFRVHKEFFPKNIACEKWPLAGKKLTPKLRTALGISKENQPSRIVIQGPHQDYLVLPNQYLVPFYSASKDYNSHALEEIGLYENYDRRQEALIISRAVSFKINAQQEISVPRTKTDIDEMINFYASMPDATFPQQSLKAGQFKLIVGAIVLRLETLGRVITQGNGHGVRIEYPDVQGADSIPPERLSQLRKEAGHLYYTLTNPAITPLLRCVLFSDRTIDRDGVLIDLISEIGKTLAAEAEDEQFVRGGVVNKIGNAIESIDQVHQALEKAITQKPTRELFEGATRQFISQSGAKFGIRNVNDIVTQLGRYADLCKARACIRGDDRQAYDEIFREKSALNELFIDENGLLESMRRVGRGSSVEMQELRSLLKSGMRAMERTAYSRTACNETAPRIWIPSIGLESAETPAMERYLNARFTRDEDRDRVRELHGRHLKQAKRDAGAAQGLPETDRWKFLQRGEDQRALEMRREFCSLGVLTHELDALKDKLQHHQIQPVAKELSRQR